MILPNKYITIEASFIGESAKILSVIGNKKLSVEKLWKITSAKYTLLSIEKFIQVLTYMFACGMIQYDGNEGMIYNENLQS